MTYFANIKRNTPEPIPPQPPNLFSGMGYVYADWYPHSPQDSYLWMELFMIASSINHDIAVRLEYVRMVGAWLMLDQQWGFRIQPIIDPNGMNGWRSQEQYNNEGKNQLSVYGQQIINCLATLRRKYDQGLITA